MTTTPKQALLAHINDMHHGRVGRMRARRVRLDRLTLAQLQADHGYTHHRLSPNHHHGPTRGPDDRPVGWYTGENATPIERKGF